MKKLLLSLSFIVALTGCIEDSAKSDKQGTTARITSSETGRFYSFSDSHYDKYDAALNVVDPVGSTVLGPSLGWDAGKTVKIIIKGDSEQATYTYSRANIVYSVFPHSNLDTLTYDDLIGKVTIALPVDSVGGGTYTFNELREDLEAAGFTEIEVLRRDEYMNSVVGARKVSGA